MHCIMSMAFAIHLNDKIKLAITCWATGQPDISLAVPPAQDISLDQHMARKD